MEHKLSEIRETLEMRKANAYAAIQWGRTSDDVADLEYKFDRACHRLAFFNHIASRPPEGTELVLLDNIPICKSITEERKLFSQSLGRAFFKAVLKDGGNREALLEMGIKPHHCAEIAATGIVPTHPNGLPVYDLVVGHIRELAMGGTNEFDNLYLLPVHLEDVKTHLAEIQKPVLGERAHPDKTHLALIPISQNGQIPKVPLIPGGFRKPVVKQERVSRIEEFLSIKQGQWKHSDSFEISNLGAHPA